MNSIIFIWGSIDSFKYQDVSISPQRKELCDSLMLEDDKKRCVLSEVLLKQGLKQMGIAEVEYVFNNNGKPYLKNHPNIFFNISHSNNYVVCVISNNEIGVDIQYEREVNMSLADKFFSNNEQSFICNSQDKKKAFSYIFSCKEAYIKCLGEKVDEHFKDFDVTTDLGYQFKNIDMFDGYQCVICCKEKIDEIKTLQWSV